MKEAQPYHPNFDEQYPHCGVPMSTFMGDPRINDKQMAELVKTCEHDHDTLVLGIDENHLPVVRARVGKPAVSRRWAIKRNGDPTDAGRVFEVWGAPEPELGSAA